MTIVWRKSAQIDISRIARHIAEENPIAARQVFRELLLAGKSLELFPYRGRPGLVPGTRELVAYHPYILVYRVANNGVAILRVWHGAQRR